MTFPVMTHVTGPEGWTTALGSAASGSATLRSDLLMLPIDIADKGSRFSGLVLIGRTPPPVLCLANRGWKSVRRVTSEVGSRTTACGEFVEPGEFECWMGEVHALALKPQPKTLNHENVKQEDYLALPVAGRGGHHCITCLSRKGSRIDVT